MFNLRRPDAKGNRSERTVCRGMAVATHDRHPWLGEALFGSDDVHDSLTGVENVEEGDAELLGILLHHIDLLP